MKFEEFSVLNYYTLFSGIFRYDKKDIVTATFRQHYGNWIERMRYFTRKELLTLPLSIPVRIKCPAYGFSSKQVWS